MTEQEFFNRRRRRNSARAKACRRLRDALADLCCYDYAGARKHARGIEELLAVAAKENRVVQPEELRRLVEARPAPPARPGEESE